MALTGVQLYDNMKNWQVKHENNVIVTNKMLSIAPEKGWDENIIFDVYNEKKEEIGTQFNFMEGKDPNNEEAYNEQLGKLGQGNLLDFDTNKDGEVSLVEYVTNELENVDLSDEELASETIVNSVLLFNLMDQAMGNSDSSGTLSAQEFASLYKNFDLQDGQLNGEFSIDEPSKFINWAIGEIFSEETKNQVRDTYVEPFMSVLSEE